MRRSLLTDLRWLFPLLLNLCSAWSASATTLYRWTDPNGVIHWSDRPVAGSTPVESAVAQSVPSAAPSAARTSPANRAAGTSVPLYTSAEILAPTDGAVLFELGGEVECAAQLNPPLSPGHSIWFEMDGIRYDSHGALMLRLPAPRGTHVLRVIVRNVGGDELITSAPVTFYVRQASIATPPVGPSVKPKSR